MGWKEPDNLHLFQILLNIVRMRLMESIIWDLNVIRSGLLTSPASAPEWESVKRLKKKKKKKLLIKFVILLNLHVAFLA